MSAPEIPPAAIGVTEPRLVTTLEFGGAVILVDAIIAIERRPWVSQAAAARVVLHLSNGQTIIEFYGDGPDADARAKEGFVSVESRWRAWRAA